MSRKTKRKQEVSKARGKRRKPRKNTARSKTKCPGLYPKFHPKNRWEYLDQDYLDKLSPEEKEFLSKFNDEFYGASLEKASEPKKWRKDLHKTKRLRKDCRDRNNARNRDVLSLQKVKGNLDPLDNTSIQKPTVLDNHEDVIVELIDLKQKVENTS